MTISISPRNLSSYFACHPCKQDDPWSPSVRVCTSSPAAFLTLRPSSGTIKLVCKSRGLRTFFSCPSHSGWHGLPWMRKNKLPISFLLQRCSNEWTLHLTLVVLQWWKTSSTLKHHFPNMPNLIPNLSGRSNILNSWQMVGSFRAAFPTSFDYEDPLKMSNNFVEPCESIWPFNEHSDHWENLMTKSS